MRISLHWLKEYIDIDVPAEELAAKLTMLGLEIESIERPGAEVSGVVTGKILSIAPHPKADKLVVCRTDIGRDEPLQIICGAKNMKAGDVVPTAVVGATLPGGFTIGARKMRGLESFGMMCSARELGLGEDHSGLLILDPGTPVGQDCVALLGLDDVVFEIEVTPNRGDWAGLIGVARELAALFGTTYRLPEITVDEGDAAAADLSSVIIEEPDLCPRYCGRVLTNVTIGPSPLWLCQRLIAAGLRPINNVVDVTNYVLIETAHPLHAFDYDALDENRIVVRRARTGETIKTIDGEVRTLSEEMLIIADASKPVAVAGVMGGHDSEVGETTTKVFLESAYFKPTSVRATARALGMMTEASQRFQRGADPEMALFAIQRAARLIRQVAGADVAAGVLDERPLRAKPIEVALRHERTNALLGTEVPAQEQERILERLGFEVVNRKAGAFTVRVPTWRHDVSHEADLIEEIARLYGYDRIAITLPRIRQNENAKDFGPFEKPSRALRRSLVGQGLTEMMHMTFTSPQAVANAGLNGPYLDMVSLQNPLSETMSTMRTSLMPRILATVSDNLKRGAGGLRAFEMGPVFFPSRGEDLPRQAERLAIVLTGPAAPAHWSGPPRPVDFYDIKGYAETVLDFFGLTDPAFKAGDFGPFDPLQTARIEADDVALGWMGLVRSGVLRKFDIEQATYLLELDLDRLLTRPAPVAQFEPMANFPPSLRDMAVVVDAHVPAGEISRLAQRTGGGLLKRVDIFDIYTGEQIPAGKKSIALSLVFQSPKRTLTDKDTQKAWDKILRTLQKEFGAELR